MVSTLNTSSNCSNMDDTVMQTSTSAIRVGLSGCGGGLESVPMQQLLTTAVEAERLGFDALWINEEHFQGNVCDVDGVGRICLSPVVLASAILARTTRIRVGFSVLVLPTHNPIRLAEEIAALDQLSGGRVDVGLSRGHPRYLQIFAPNYLNEDFFSSMNTLTQAWRGETLSISDHEIVVTPGPFQKPHPPIYIGTYSEDLMDWIVSEGYQIICHGITSIDKLRSLMSAFVRAGGNPVNVPLGRFVYVSESDTLAKDEIWPTILNLTARLRKIGIDKRGIISSELLEPSRFLHEVAIVGSADSCAEKLASLMRDTGSRYLNLLSSFFAYLPQSKLHKSLRLFATVVAPQLALEFTESK